MSLVNTKQELLKKLLPFRSVLQLEGAATRTAVHSYGWAGIHLGAGRPGRIPKRFACYDLANGVEKWRSGAMGKYVSLVANQNKILALDERGDLLLIRANPEKFDLMASKKIGENSWAHLAVRGDLLFIRDLNELIALKWQ